MLTVERMRRVGTVALICALTCVVGCPPNDPLPATNDIGRGVTGACCAQDETCAQTRFDDCRTNGNVFQGEGTDCGVCGTEDDVRLGACCFANGGCLTLTRDDCVVGEGQYEGNDTSCDDVECPNDLVDGATVGACCTPDGCVDGLTRDDCELDGAYQGNDTDCADADVDCSVGDVVPQDALVVLNELVPFATLPLGVPVSLVAPGFETLTRINEGCSCSWSTDGEGTFDPQTGEDACTTLYTPGADDTQLVVIVTCLGESRTAEQTVNVLTDTAAIDDDTNDGGDPPGPCEGVDCGDNNACTVDTCVGGVCIHDPDNLGKPCGDASTSDCDNRDRCDSFGNCLPDNEPDGTICTDDGNECTHDVCLAGVCDHPGTDAGIVCGDQTVTDCDSADSCDGAGNCDDNFAANGFGCDDGDLCTNPDVCDGAGVCAGTLTCLVIDTVTIGNLGNADDTHGDGYGGVDYAYNIGRYEVTAGQYTQFLNAVADEDTHGLYDTRMLSDRRGCKIRRTGSSGSYVYLVDADEDGVEDADWLDRPVNYVSWVDSARFANWMHNGQPTGAQELGTTEDGSYSLDGVMTGLELLAITRNPDATWVIPSEDEWYKAAYHMNDGVTGNYWDYPTGHDSIPSNALGEPTDPGNNATFATGGGDDDTTIGSPYFRTEVGAHENSNSPYGTSDQGGNIWEWNDTALSTGRGLRGGSFIGGEFDLRALARESGGNFVGDQDVRIGFRVAEVP